MEALARSFKYSFNLNPFEVEVRHLVLYFTSSFSFSMLSEIVLRIALLSLSGL